MWLIQQVFLAWKERSKENKREFIWESYGIILQLCEEDLGVTLPEAPSTAFPAVLSDCRCIKRLGDQAVWCILMPFASPLCYFGRCGSPQVSAIGSTMNTAQFAGSLLAGHILSNMCRGVALGWSKAYDHAEGFDWYRSALVCLSKSIYQTFFSQREAAWFFSTRPTVGGNDCSRICGEICGWLDVNWGLIIPHRAGHSSVAFFGAAGVLMGLASLSMVAWTAEFSTGCFFWR